MPNGEDIRTKAGDIVRETYLNLAAKRYIQLMKKYDELNQRLVNEGCLFNESALQNIRKRANTSYTRAERVLEVIADIGGPGASAALYREIISRVCEEQGIPYIRLGELI